MLPIPFLSPAVTIAATGGKAVAAAAAGVDFASLLPGFVVPVQPRQPHAEGGKDLPATPTGEDEDGKGAVAWTIPPLWPAVCPPIAAPREEPGLAGRGLVPTAIVPSAPAASAPVPLAPVPLSRHEVTSAGGVAITSTDLSSDPTATGAMPERAVQARPIAGTVPPLAASVASPPLVTPGAFPLPAPLVVAPPSAPHAAVDAPANAPTLSVPPKGAAEAPGDQRIVTAAAARVAPTAAALLSAQPPRVAPAAQIFAAAIHQAVREERRPLGAEQAIAPVAPTTDLAPHAVTAADSSRHAALDMARETWPTKMIERIELLRDAADATDTSIRLVPDKLGAIDISLRRDGDGVAVHFTAQQAETRQLLAEAQPRLADMAEAKGIRLSMQSGDGHSGQQPPPQQQRAAVATPSITPLRASSQDDDGAADERIA